MFEIIDPGAMTTVQDIGRQHSQSLGIPPSGAQDTLGLRIANLLVGNASGGPLIRGFGGWEGRAGDVDS
jgi:allophanate hydrolase subunit 2